jgi:hypothetical protein
MARTASSANDQRRVLVSRAKATSGVTRLDDEVTKLTHDRFFFSFFGPGITIEVGPYHERTNRMT